MDGEVFLLPLGVSNVILALSPEAKKETEVLVKHVCMMHSP